MIRDHYVEAVLDVFFPDGVEHITDVEDAIKSGRAKLITDVDTTAGDHVALGLGTPAIG